MGGAVEPLGDTLATIDCSLTKRYHRGTIVPLGDILATIDRV